MNKYDEELDELNEKSEELDDLPEIKTTYPIKLKVSAKFLEELFNCEYGRYEDAQNAREDKDEELIKMNNYELVFCDFGDRFKTQIEIRNKEELAETWYALASGTIGLYACDAANNALDKIREATTKEFPELVKKWPVQDGY